MNKTKTNWSDQALLELSNKKRNNSWQKKQNYGTYSSKEVERTDLCIFLRLEIKSNQN